MQTIETIDSLDALDSLFTASEAVWVFKHSLTCPVSDAALAEYRRFAAGAPAAARLTLIEIQRARPLSAAVEARSGVRHESPQALLLQAGEVLWHASHWQITAAALDGATAKTA